MIYRLTTRSHRCVFSAQISSLVAPFVIVINQYNAELVYTVLFMFCIAGESRDPQPGTNNSQFMY